MDLCLETNTIRIRRRIQKTRLHAPISTLLRTAKALSTNLWTRTFGLRIVRILILLHRTTLETAIRTTIKPMMMSADWTNPNRLPRTPSMNRQAALKKVMKGSRQKTKTDAGRVALHASSWRCTWLLRAWHRWLTWLVLSRAPKMRNPDWRRTKSTEFSRLESADGKLLKELRKGRT